MSTTYHDDFGAKIGGAKKDVWQQRGLLVNDLSEMNEREAAKYVKKNNIWKKINYQALIDKGIPSDVVYFMKTVYDSIATSLRLLKIDDTVEKIFNRRKEYIDTVHEIQEVVGNVKNTSDIFDVFTKCLVDNGYCEPIGKYTNSPVMTKKGRENQVISTKLAYALFIKSESIYEWKIKNKAIEEGCGVSKEDKIPRGFSIVLNDGESQLNSDNFTQGTYYVKMQGLIIKANFETRESALKWIQFMEQRGRKNEKIRFVPKPLDCVERDGPDYRHGRNIDGEDYILTFGFKGGEFGNWLNQNDRQNALNHGYDALKDLAAALKISDNDISYQGILSIAFGARGSGNALAHYEPLRNVINLTKLSGAGSLAHEWWHGLDDFLGGKMGLECMLSEKPQKYPLFEKLISTIKFKPLGSEQIAINTEGEIARVKQNAANLLDYEMKSYIDHDTVEYEKMKDAFLQGENGSVDRLSDFKKKITGRVMIKSMRDKLLRFESYLRINGHLTVTEYYSNSMKFGKAHKKSGNYWDSNAELTARAFATYVMDALHGRSDYLIGHAECAICSITEGDSVEVLQAYPKGEERISINAVFDEIFADLKSKHYLTHCENSMNMR